MMNPIKAFMEEVEAKVLQKQSDVISLIKADHRKVDLLFDDYKNAENESDKQAILKSIVEDLKVHSKAEENKVYPTLDKADHDGTNESLEEHHLIKILLEELSGKGLAADKEAAKVKVLSEVVKHHVKEEEGKYLPELQNSGADLDQLGEDFTVEKERLLADPSSMDEDDDEDEDMKKPARRKASGAKRATAKKATAKKASAKKAPAKKAVAKKTSAKKTTSAKKAAPKKATAKKATAKKATAKKAAPAKKAIAKKATPKSAAAKKTAAKKAPAKKATAAKKSAPVKLAAKKPAARRKAS